MKVKDLVLDRWEDIVVGLLEDELERWKAGDVRITVANQFDMYALESALEECEKDGVLEAAKEKFATANINSISAIDLAHTLSEWEAPEISSAWID